MNLIDLTRDTLEEKRLEYGELENIKIDFLPECEVLDSLIDGDEFKRLLSNLINNSIEARNSSIPLILKIGASLEGESAIISISDNGFGIPKIYLDKLGKSEFTTKKEGNGLGLVHSFESIANWNGKMLIDSEEGKGTTIKIILPLVETQKNWTILLDDDELVRLTWQATAQKNNVEFIAFEKPRELFSALDKLSSNSLFYIDSQLGDGILGEDIAKELYEKGFKEIFITSGFESSHFKNLSFIKGIRDKKTPW